MGVTTTLSVSVQYCTFTVTYTLTHMLLPTGPQGLTPHPVDCSGLLNARHVWVRACSSTCHKPHDNRHYEALRAVTSKITTVPGAEETSHCPREFKLLRTSTQRWVSSVILFYYCDEQNVNSLSTVTKS